MLLRAHKFGMTCEKIGDLPLVLPRLEGAGGIDERAAPRKELRGALAKKARLPAYVIFSNATLMDMAKKRPQTMTQFRKVSGVGEIKAAWYGTAFLERIQQFQEEGC